MSTNKSTCAICQQPMTLIVVGPKRFPMYVHRGQQLEQCKAIRLKYNFAKILLERMKKFNVALGMKFVDGHVMIHGEKRAEFGRRNISEHVVRKENG